MNVSAMGALITEVVAEPDFDQRGALIKKLEDLEHDNDELTHQIFQELGKNFITPFDREDIHYLAIALDDICDYIYASAKKINFYKVKSNLINLTVIILEISNRIISRQVLIPKI